jgi:hypothetical protein
MSATKNLRIGFHLITTVLLATGLAAGQSQENKSENKDAAPAPVTGQNQENKSENKDAAPAPVTGQNQENKSEKKDAAPATASNCSAKEIKSGKEKGPQKRFYEAPLPKVKEAMIGALASLEFEVKKDTGNEISAQKSRHVGVFVGSGGETVILKLGEAEEGGKKGTSVEGETKKGFVGRAGQKSWTNAILDQAACIMSEKASL